MHGQHWVEWSWILTAPNLHRAKFANLQYVVNCKICNISHDQVSNCQRQLFEKIMFVKCNFAMLYLTNMQHGKICCKFAGLPPGTVILQIC